MHNPLTSLSEGRGGGAKTHPATQKKLSILWLLRNGDTAPKHKIVALCQSRTLWKHPQPASWMNESQNKGSNFPWMDLFIDRGRAAQHARMYACRHRAVGLWCWENIKVSAEGRTRTTAVEKQQQQKRTLTPYDQTASAGPVPLVMVCGQATSRAVFENELVIVMLPACWK